MSVYSPEGGLGDYQNSGKKGAMSGAWRWMEPNPNSQKIWGGTGMLVLTSWELLAIPRTRGHGERGWGADGVRVYMLAVFTGVLPPVPYTFYIDRALPRWENPDGVCGDPSIVISVTCNS